MLSNDFNRDETINLNDNDFHILKTIEHDLAITIPKVGLIQRGKIGFVEENGFITELSLCSVPSNDILPIICNFNKLEKLCLNNSQIKIIPSTISKLKFLTHLSLKMNRISIVPPELYKLPNLKFLNLSYNLIYSFNTSPSDLASLEYLFLEYNKLVTVNFSSYSCTNLIELYLNNNRITEVNVESLVRLKSLALQNNFLNHFPNIEHLTELESIELHFNKIEKIDNDFSNFGHLEQISLSYNNIKEINPKSLDKLKVLCFFINGNPLSKSANHTVQSFKKKMHIR